MTKEQQQLRSELDRIAELAAEVARLEVRIQQAQDNLAKAAYETQQKWGK